VVRKEVKIGMAHTSQVKPIRSYRDLIVWQRAITLAEKVYETTRRFPKDELYGLTSKMRRAAVSIASNIAEGQGRNSRGELLQFLGHARGSLSELETQAVVAVRIGLLKADAEQQLAELTIEVGRLLNGLRSSLQGSVARKSSS
jgi:four helix bundle protein